MPKIVVLPDHVASQIAAGEVVERPASVVKELVENSIDAGASQIEIAIGADCRDIRVADNGSGMEPEDVVLAFQRHATSKLQSADDLSSLRTLGFRGEALPSIASVAKVTCYTRTASAEKGTRVDTQDGKVSAREVGCSQGTVIEITDLFYNVPARLSFLKKATTEFGHIHEIVQMLAIAHPSVTFQLLNNGEVVLRTSGSGKLAQTLQEAGILTGKEELINVTHADLRYGMAIYGYVARPPHSRGDRRGLVTIVNNRPVKCAVSYKALDHAYSDLIPKGKHPIGVITITVDPKEVDVNIHPTKKEVKYRNSSDVYLSVQQALKQALQPPVPTASELETQIQASVNSSVHEPSFATAAGGTPVVQEGQEPYSAGRPLDQRATHQRIQQISLRDRLAYTPAPATSSRPTSPIADPGGKGRLRMPPVLPAGWRVIGYLHNTYILVQTENGLMIVEQHIAHERVIYERLIGQQSVPGRLSEHVQRLVISAPLELKPEQRACLVDHLDVLEKLGFDFDVQGDQVACTQIPLELATKDYASSVQTNVENMLTAGTTDFQREATKSVACQAAIKDGMPLSESEITELLAEWSRAPRNDTCPHGRPIALRFSYDKLFQMFHPD
ncbi:MAG TPA: DNA mismatch repair endonuclease MutL [Candidatus Obscuribacterales bacterium]